VGWLRYALFFACLSTAGCSSDAAPIPEPDIKHAGSFVAYGQGELTLIRTLQAISLGNDYVVFATIYDVTPTSFDEARALAQQPDLPVRQGYTAGSESLLKAQRHEVVWFRTLTAEEANRGK
jgi:hypothetical protein